MITVSPGIRVLRRRVLIRETDFPTLRRNALRPNHPLSPLYDTAVFTPVNTTELANAYLMNLLKGEQPGPEKYYDTLKKYLHVQSHSLYNPNYLEYKIFDDSSGQIYLQYRKDSKPSKLGWGVLEKWYKKHDDAV
jgi:hypothetical protein